MTGPRRCGTVPGVAEHRRLRLPLFTSLRGYDPGWLRGDVIAGLTVWAVLVPEALAYASIAGVSPVVGLYAAPGALLLYAAFGSSRHLVVGPMSATAALSAAAVADVATPNSAGFVAHTTALAVTTGLLALAAGLLRLGFLADFNSSPVLAGFKAGMGLFIAASQLGKVLGVPVEGDDFFAKVWSALGQLGDANLATVALALGGLAALLALHRWAPKVPGPLVVVVLGIALVAATDLEGRGVALVGPVNGGLPTFQLPPSRRHGTPAAGRGRDRADVVHRVHLGCSRPTRPAGAPPRPRSTTGPGPGPRWPSWSRPRWPSSP
jgi:SulP family sulfate permease